MSRFVALAPVAALAPLTALLLAPAYVFYANPFDFHAPFSRVVVPLAGLAAAGSAALLALLVAPRAAGARELATSVVLALGVLTWVQATILTWSYGPLDGRRIDWTAHRAQGLADTAVWLAGLGAAVAGRRRLAPAAPAVAAGLIAIQGVAVAIQVAGAPARWVDEVSFDGTTRFAFSPDRNVVVIVLDTFQSDLFQEILDESPDLASQLGGFTYFRNASGGFPSTAPSIPLLLTGRRYDNSVPFQDFVRDSFRNASLPRALTRAGFDVQYYSPSSWPSLYADASIAADVRPRRTRWRDLTRLTDAVPVLWLGLFRSVPQPVKRLLVGSGSRPAHLPVSVDTAPPEGPASASRIEIESDASLSATFAARASATLPAPAFRYFHLWGIHPPLAYDDRLQPVSAAYTRENARRQGRGVLRHLASMIGALQRIGIYDRTLLVVAGDHGTIFEPRLAPVDESVRMSPEAIAVPTRHSFGLPLLLVKRRGARGQLAISDTPVSLGDVARSVADEMGVPSALPGTSVFAIDRPGRPRIVMRYDPDALRLSQGYFPILTEYSVSGFSWLAESWRLTGRRFHPGGRTVDQPPTAYTFGQVLEFGRGGTAAPYLAEGWAAPEAGFNWTEGPSATLRLRTPPPGGDVVFRASLVPALAGGIKSQRVEVLLDSRRVGGWTISRGGEQRLVIPQSLLGGGELDLTLLLPDAFVPHQVDPASGDTRELAVAVFRAVLETAPATRP